jgi:hypothetical protein
MSHESHKPDIAGGPFGEDWTFFAATPAARVQRAEVTT